MASKSIQILVNEFPAAADSSVVAVVSAAGIGIIVEVCAEGWTICSDRFNPFIVLNECALRFTSRPDAVDEKGASARRATRFNRPEIPSRMGEGRLVRGASCRI